MMACFWCYQAMFHLSKLAMNGDGSVTCLSDTIPRHLCQGVPNFTLASALLHAAVNVSRGQRFVSVGDSLRAVTASQAQSAQSTVPSFVPEGQDIVAWIPARLALVYTHTLQWWKSTPSAGAPETSSVGRIAPNRANSRYDLVKVNLALLASRAWEWCGMIVLCVMIVAFVVLFALVVRRQ